MITLGLYCLVTRRNLIKMVIGLSIMTDGIHLLLVSLGYRIGGIAPIWSPQMGEEMSEFAARAVDPVPQALVLTSIVINMGILALALSLAIRLYKHHNTLNPFNITDLKG